MLSENGGSTATGQNKKNNRFFRTSSLLENYPETHNAPLATSPALL